jgi:hypothetical protein
MVKFKGEDDSYYENVWGKVGKLKRFATTVTTGS